MLGKYPKNIAKTPEKKVIPNTSPAQAMNKKITRAKTNVEKIPEPAEPPLAQTKHQSGIPKLLLLKKVGSCLANCLSNFTGYIQTNDQNQ